MDADYITPWAEYNITAAIYADFTHVTTMRAYFSMVAAPLDPNATYTSPWYSYFWGQYVTNPESCSSYSYWYGNYGYKALSYCPMNLTGPQWVNLSTIANPFGDTSVPFVGQYTVSVTLEYDYESSTTFEGTTSTWFAGLPSFEAAFTPPEINISYVDHYTPFYFNLTVNTSASLMPVVSIGAKLEMRDDVWYSLALSASCNTSVFDYPSDDSKFRVDDYMSIAPGIMLAPDVVVDLTCVGYIGLPSPDMGYHSCGYSGGMCRLNLQV